MDALEKPELEKRYPVYVGYWSLFDPTKAGMNLADGAVGKG